MTKKKPKRMTAAEKKLNKEIREELRAKGILPPVKPKLNRKKFLQETFERWDQADGDVMYYLTRAIGCMVSKDQHKVTPEEVGVLKVMRLAIEIQAFEKRLEAEGRLTYTAGEFYEQVMRPVIDL